MMFKASFYLIAKNAIYKNQKAFISFSRIRYTLNKAIRNSSYSYLNESDINYFKDHILNGDSARCITDTQILQAYNKDWLNITSGKSKLVLLPKNAQEVSKILMHCNERKLAVCPQGGRTGLVGGSVPIFDEIIVSTRLMDNIISLDMNSNILNCQSGCVLQKLDEHLSKNGLIMPLDLGAKGSCHIGGNISTNAGGLRLLRYGSLKGTVLGLEVVLANGEILDLMKTPVRKDNTGYDLKQLFIGSEGTLGFITGCSILCPTKPNAVNVALVAVSGESFENVLKIFKATKRELNEVLSAFEFMDSESMRAVNENLKLKNPFSSQISMKANFYCLIETHGSNNDHDRSKIESLFGKLMSENLCLDVVMAENNQQVLNLWGLRERIAEALTKDGFNYKYDISLPLNSIYQLVIDLRERLKKEAIKRCIGYGHLGDGNLHLNLTTKEFDPSAFNLIEPYVYEWARQKNGSISAEHGLGSRKRDYIYYSKPKEAVQLMKLLKKTLDPNYILNPYKTLPEN